MDRSVVVIVPCDNYEKETVYEALKTGIGLLGGIDKFVNPSEKILVKPNFLLQEKVEKAATTHPAVISGMLRILKEAGADNVKMGDSPGHGTCEGIAKNMGLGNEYDMYGASIAPMNEEVLFKFPEGKVAKEFWYTKEIAEADAIINLCKMKTHALERITGAVKNVYGFVCGSRKARGHVKYPSAVVFAEMLTDIHRSTPIRLHVMDGIVAMEGNGPGSGDPISMNVLLFSTDPVALDSVFANLVDINTGLIPTCWKGRRAGIGTDREEEIRILVPDNGEAKEISFEEAFKRFGNADFDVDRTGKKNSMTARLSRFAMKFAKKPYIDADLCVKCGVCVSHCPIPEKAVDFRNGKDNIPVYDYKKCIRCYCCQEMCPKHAIKTK